MFDSQYYINPIARQIQSYPGPTRTAVLPGLGYYPDESLNDNSLAIVPKTASGKKWDKKIEEGKSHAKVAKNAKQRR